MDYKHLFHEKIFSAERVGGGDIGRSSCVTTEKGKFFVKYYSVPGTAAAEAAGLKAIAAAEAIKVPQVIKYDEHFIVLEFINSAARCSGFMEQLGAGLAQLHLTSENSAFGFHHDNFIGSTPQKNSWFDDWIEFLAENRLGYQIGLARDSGLEALWKRLRERLPELLESSIEKPCLIHGDLWAGNYMIDQKGLPMLIDPAAYYGHREMDLAMTMLFGGFSEDFYTAYDKTYPLKEGWRERAGIYKLYHVLNHLNMFGGGYRSQAMSIIRNYV